MSMNQKQNLRAETSFDKRQKKKKIRYGQGHSQEGFGGLIQTLICSIIFINLIKACNTCLQRCEKKKAKSCF